MVCGEAETRWCVCEEVKQDESLAERGVEDPCDFGVEGRFVG